VLATVTKLGLIPAAVSYPASYGPKDFWSVYDAPPTATGTGQRLAIIRG
jgi:hypothetical protein